MWEIVKELLVIASIIASGHAKFIRRETDEAIYFLVLAILLLL